ncbi:hypothetical protein PV10_02794 [Exophiala mesophila]|uniref:Uncharacterized protein n=1 Tax=Exophiala mesophila TaxID=212818 RepID=A0A0D2A819_EXOME|nr:uncharacterized protein PV10_02794 [Exophiala mesophila]KIV95103.1 hypothetical protein PV10_02794 [Exophiala mesophila]
MKTVEFPRMDISDAKECIVRDYWYSNFDSLNDLANGISSQDNEGEVGVHELSSDFIQTRREEWRNYADRLPAPFVTQPESLAEAPSTGKPVLG